MKYKRALVGLAIVAVLGCASHRDEARKPLTLATTTSTRDSGLLDELIPMFEQQTGIKVKMIAVGSGQAIEMGRRGDADVLLTHSPAAEKTFLADGFGSERRSVMHNDFVLVGPAKDPARIKSQKNITDAFKQLSRSRAPFVSRGDESGTHMKERQIWQQAGIKPERDWYVEAGSGMAEVLRMASEKSAYTLADRGTFLAQRKGLNLDIILQGDPILNNSYAVILINPARFPHLNHEAARQFADFLMSAKTQEAIGKFGVSKFGEPLFFAERQPQPQ